MKAIVCDVYGGPERLELRDAPDPAPGPGELVLRVEAAGVNFADAMMRLGLYPGAPDPPLSLGFEAAGTVESIGAAVETVQPGDRVMGPVHLQPTGGYAEKAVMDASKALRIPASLSFEEGAAFHVAFLTAYACLHLCARLRAGETVLIHAAGGGVGTAAVQLARQRGARIIATAGSDEKLSRVRELGADVTLNYRTAPFSDAIREATEGRGVDVVLDSVGGDVFDESLRLLAPLGRIVTFGIASRATNAPKTSTLLFHSWGVIGFHLSAIESNLGLYRSCADALLAMAEDGRIRPVVGHRFPLSRASDAHCLLESRESYGKIVLLPGARSVD